MFIEFYLCLQLQLLGLWAFYQRCLARLLEPENQRAALSVGAKFNLWSKQVKQSRAKLPGKEPIQAGTFGQASCWNSGCPLLP